jgi:hypothetical protein
MNVNNELVIKYHRSGDILPELIFSLFNEFGDKMQLSEIQ